LKLLCGYFDFALRAHLKSLGISVRSATEPIDDTSTGKLMEGVLAAFAQFDNDVRSERTRGGMKAALKLGRWTFLAPLGYLNAPRSSGKSLIPDPERASLVRHHASFATGDGCTYLCRVSNAHKPSTVDGAQVTAFRGVENRRDERRPETGGAGGS